MALARSLLVLAILALTLSATAAAAPPEPLRVAVLEFRNADLAVAPGEADYVAEIFRTQAVRALLGDRYTLMTRESMERMLPAGVTIQSCNEATCELQVGSMLEADYIVTGLIVRVGDELRITARIYDVKKTKLLDSRNVKGTSILGMEPELERVASQIFAPIPGAVAPPALDRDIVIPAPPPIEPTSEPVVHVLPPTEMPPPTAGGPAGLYITTVPPGAEVYLNGAKTGRADPAFQKANLVPGTRVRITLRLAPYHDYVFDVDLKPGVTRFEKVPLEQAFGTLSIDSDPPGATVLLGGVEVGVTPYADSRCPSGEYVLGLEKEWYLPVSDERILVRDGQDTAKRFALLPNFGTLSVASRPSGARVTFDGKELGTTPGNWRVAPVHDGILEVALDGYRGQSFSITIDRGQTVEIGDDDLVLVERVGALQIYADPPLPGARVTLDGHDVGAAPLDRAGVPVGSHTIEIRTNDFQGKRTVAVKEGETTSVTVDLKPIPKGEPYSIIIGLGGVLSMPGAKTHTFEPSSSSSRDWELAGNEVYDIAGGISFELGMRVHFVQFGGYGSLQWGDEVVEDGDDVLVGTYAGYLGWVHRWSGFALSLDMMAANVEENFIVEGVDQNDDKTETTYKSVNFALYARPRLMFTSAENYWTRKTGFFFVDPMVDVLNPLNFGIGLGLAIAY